MLHLTIGSAWGRKFSFFKADRRTELNLYNKTIKVLVKKEKTDADEDAILPVLTFEDVDSNYIVPQWTATQTASLKEGVYYFGIKIYTTDDLDREVYNDIIEVKKGVFNG